MDRALRLYGVSALVGANDEAIRAWDGPLYERFVRFRESETITTGLGVHGEEALRPRALLGDGS